MSCLAWRVLAEHALQAQLKCLHPLLGRAGRRSTDCGHSGHHHMSGRLHVVGTTHDQKEG